MNWLSEINRHQLAVERTLRTLRDPFMQFVEDCKGTLLHGGKLLFFGNGGSAAQAQHFAAELVVRYARDRGAMPALALTADTSILTAAGNDLGYADVFVRQIRALCQPNDMAVGLTTSGNSTNVILGLDAARGLGAKTAALCGPRAPALLGMDHVILVPYAETARIQEVHLLLGHMLCQALEEAWRNR